MKSVFFLLLFLIHTAPFWAQMHDNTWILGYGRPRTDFLIGLTKLTFEDGTIKMDTIQNPGFGYYHNNSAFSDDKGDLIAYFDGNDIMNKQYEFMENGKGMNKEIIENNYYLSSEFMSQASVMIPWPGHPDSILVLYSSLFIIATPDMTDVVSLDLSMAVINRKSNNNDGKLIIRDSILLKDTIQSGRLNPIRHANGRDWWLLISERGHNRFYTILIDPQGPKIVGQQTLGFLMKNGIDGGVFTPDGSKYIIHNGVDFDAAGVSINFFDFDRCTGRLSNHEQYFMKGNFGGVSIAPNGRYIYQNVRDTAWRYDLEAPDIWASREVIAVYDGFKGPFSTYQMQLAPDGKIYSSATNAVNYLHVIHQPDEEDCQYQQHGIKLPKYTGFSVPNFPHFRLGPLDGSPCDTLGLNNDPRA